jgi:hypothetical protein
MAESAADLQKQLVLPFCQIGLVDNLSKDYGFYQVSKLHTLILYLHEEQASWIYKN